MKSVKLKLVHSGSQDDFLCELEYLLFEIADSLEPYFGNKTVTRYDIYRTMKRRRRTVYLAQIDVSRDFLAPRSVQYRKLIEIPVHLYQTKDERVLRCFVYDNALIEAVTEVLSENLPRLNATHFRIYAES